MVIRIVRVRNNPNQPWVNQFLVAVVPNKKKYVCASGVSRCSDGTNVSNVKRYRYRYIESGAK